MVKADPGMEATEKRGKKKRKSLPEVGGLTDTQAKSKKVKKKKKESNGNAVAADDVTNGVDVSAVKEEECIEVSKSRKKKRTGEETSGEGALDPTGVTNGKSKKKKKTGGEKNSDGAKPEPVSEDVLRVGDVKKTTGGKGDGQKKVSSDGAMRNEGRVEEEEEKRQKKKSKRKAPAADSSGAEADDGGRAGNVPEDGGCSGVRENGVEGAPMTTKKKRKRTAGKKDGGNEEETGEEVNEKKKKPVVAEMGVGAEAIAGETDKQHSKKKRKKEKGSDVVSVEERADVDPGVGAEREKSKEKAAGVEAAVSPDTAAVCNGQNEKAAQTEGVPEEKKRKRKKGPAPQAVATGGDEAGNGVKTLKKKRKKEKETITVKEESGANMADVEGGQDKEEEEKEKKGQEKKTKGEKRKTPVKVEDEAVAEGLNGQEPEGEPKKKKKKEKKADLVDRAAQTGTQQAATPKIKEEQERTESSNGEKTKKKKKKKTKKQEECVTEVGDEAEGKKGMKGKKNKMTANGRRQSEEEGRAGAAEETVEDQTPQKKKTKSEKGKGEDGEETRKLRKRRKQSEEEEKKITLVKSDPEEKAVEVVFVSEKMGNMDEVTIDQARRQALQMDVDNESRPKDADSTPSLGQWSTAQFDNTSQQQKFLRLMGGFKKGNQPTGSSGGRPNMALGREGQDVLKRGLLAEFDRAQGRRTDFQNKGAGLGFAPPSNKKFAIDVAARRSVRFDD